MLLFPIGLYSVVGIRLGWVQVRLDFFLAGKVGCAWVVEVVRADTMLTSCSLGLVYGMGERVLLDAWVVWWLVVGMDG